MNNKGKFIYVFSENDRDIMLNDGYELITSDDNNHVYAFLFNNKLSFSLNQSDITYSFSDILCL